MKPLITPDIKVHQKLHAQCVRGFFGPTAMFRKMTNGAIGLTMDQVRPLLWLPMVNKLKRNQIVTAFRGHFDFPR